MKKIVFSFFLMLSTIITVFAQTNTVHSKTVISSDTSKIWIIKITEKYSTILSNKKRIDNYCTIYDTTQIIFVSRGAKRYISDSIIKVLFNSSTHIIQLIDSLVPRWTHILGKDKYVERKLEIVDDKIFFYISRSIYKQGDSIKNIYVYMKISIIVSILFIFFSFILKDTIRYARYAIGILFIYLFIVLISPLKDTFTIFDIIFLCFIVFFPSFLITLLFKSKIKVKKE